MSETKEKFFLKSKTIWASIISSVIAISPFIEKLAEEPSLSEYAPLLAGLSALLGFIGRTKADSKITFKKKAKEAEPKE